MPETYSFNGDAVTFIGMIGVVSTFIIVYSAFKNYWSSPYRK